MDWIARWMAKMKAAWVRWRAARAARLEAARRAAAEREAARVARIEEARQAEVERRRAEEARLAQVREIRQVVLNALHEGRVVEEFSAELEAAFPEFKLQKTERLLCVFSGIRYMERVVRRRVVGRTSGASVRVMKGVSVRLGGYAGRPVEYEEVVERAEGVLAISTRHVYFRGDRRSFRIHMNKVVSVAAGLDYLEVVRDRASGLPEFFAGLHEEDAQFAADLVDAAAAEPDRTRRGPDAISAADLSVDYLAAGAALGDAIGI